MGLPPDSATTRKALSAPLGWDNTTEMTAMVLDSLAVLTRLFRNANYEPDRGPLRHMPRPYEATAAAAAPAPERAKTVSLHELTDLLKEW